MAYDPTAGQVATGLRAGSGVLGGLSQVYGQGNQGTLSQAGNIAGGAGNAAGIAGGIQRGGVAGDTSAAINAAQLANRAGYGSAGLNEGVGAANNALGIYQGLEHGGVTGYGGAAANSAQLAGTLLDNPALSTVGGYIAAPLAVYNAVENYQSGKTGSDTLNGAEAGAAIGSIVPGLGTVIGGVLGAAAGALSSAFGPGAKDPETAGVQGLINATSANKNDPNIAANVQNPYLGLAGLMDRRESTLPMYQQYGRMGEQKFTNDLASQINNAFTPGKGIGSGIFAGDTWSKDPNGSYVLTTPTGGRTIYNPADASKEIYGTTVDPWVESMGSGYKNVGPEYTATTQGLLQDMTNEYINGQAANDWKAIGGDSPFASIYKNSPFTAASAPTAAPTRAEAARSGVQRQAKGGNVSDLKNRLRNLYESSFSNRKTHFDDGGYVNYLTPSIPYSLMDSTTPSEPVMQDPSQSDVWNTSDLEQALQGSDNIVNSSNDPYAYGASGNSSLNSALSALGSIAKTGAPLAPILASLLGSKNNGSAPGTAAGYSTIAPIATPSFNRQAVTNPTNNSTGTPMTQKDWYTYGTRPETNFFSNNALPTIPTVSPTSPNTSPVAFNSQPVGLAGPQRIMAEGGALSQSANLGSGASRHITGAGDGTSDDIDAKLSDGEYVMDANTVSLLGNGSNKAGAEALDRLRENLRRHAAKPMAKGKQFMKAKPPEAYLRGGRK